MWSVGRHRCPKTRGHFAISCYCHNYPLPRRRPPLKASQRGLMAHAESRRGRRARPLGLGKLGTGARLLHAGRSSCGRCSIRRRPAPGCLPCSLGSWVAIMPTPPAPSTPPPWGLSPRASPSPLFQCSILFQKCSSALEHGFARVAIGRTPSFLSFVPDK